MNRVLSAVSFHLFILIIHYCVVKIRWTRVIDQLAVHKVPDHLSRCLVKISDSALLQKASFPSNLSEESIHVFPNTNSVVCENLCMVYTVEDGFNWTHGVHDIFHSDGRSQHERVRLFLGS